MANQLPDSGEDMFNKGHLLATFKGPGKDGEVVSLTSPTGIEGRFVIVQLDHSPGTGYLNLNEVTVWGTVKGNTENVCLFFCCPRTQSLVFCPASQ